MRNLLSCLLFVAVSFSVHASGTADDTPIPLLTAVGQKFTNVTVLGVSSTHLFIRHATGMESIRLNDLDASLQKRFGYDPAKAAAELASAGGNSPDAKTKFCPWWAPTGSATSTPAKAPPGWKTKTYPVKGVGTLKLLLPETWTDSAQLGPPGNVTSLTIRLGPSSGNEFVALVSLVPASGQLKQMGPHRVLEVSGTPCLRSSEESSLDMKELNGIETDGLFFTLSDKSMRAGVPRGNRHKYQTQGFVDLDEVALSFLVSSDFSESAEYKAILNMMRTAHFEKETADTTPAISQK